MGFIRTRSTTGRSSFWTARRVFSRAAARRWRVRPARRRLICCIGRLVSSRSKMIFYHESSANEPGKTVGAGRPARHASCHRQCGLMTVSRSSVYRPPAPVSDEDLAIMALIDRQYLARPYYGSRRMTAWLATQGHRVNRKRVRRLMRQLGLVAIYQRPNTSKATAAHKTYPYLLGGLSITRANQVWCADVTYIPMARGFLYLVAIMDWHSRAVLAWQLSNTLSADFCVEALEEALARSGRPEIFNTDQGSQFTSDAFTGVLSRHEVTISMDGKGRCMDNIFIERLWRSLKYEEVYLHAYGSVAEAQAGIGVWLVFYNEERQHQSHGYHTPRQVYEAQCRWI